MSYKDALNRKFKLVGEFLLSDKFISILTVLPIFFGWLIPLTWKRDDKKLFDLATDSMILSLVFWGLLFLGILFSWTPFIGAYLANLFHLVGVMVYLGVSFLFLYFILKDIDIPELPILTKLRVKFNVYIN